MIIITFLVRNLFVAVLNSVDHPRGEWLLQIASPAWVRFFHFLLFVAFGVSLWLWEKAQVRLRACLIISILFCDICDIHVASVCYSGEEAERQLKISTRFTAPRRSLEGRRERRLQRRRDADRVIVANPFGSGALQCGFLAVHPHTLFCVTLAWIVPLLHTSCAYILWILFEGVANV